MSQPVLLVLSSLIYLVAAISLLFFLRNSKNFFFITIIVLSVLPCLSLLRAGVYESGDFAINIERATSLWESLQFGIFPVRWAANLNAGYGYPAFIFTYPIPHYLIVIPHFFGVSFIAAEKLMMATSFILSGIGMYLFARLYMNKMSSSFASILYLFAPYHLVDLHFRISIGEIVAFAILPFLFLSAKKYCTKRDTPNFILLSFLVFILMLSQQAISLFTIPSLLLYMVFSSKKLSMRKWLFVPLPVAIGLLLSCFYWLPVILEIKYTHQAIFSSSVYLQKIPDLLYSPWYYGFLFQGPKGELSHLVGYAHLAMVIIAIFMINKFAKKIKSRVITLLILFCFAFFMITTYSSFVWNSLPLVKNFQFSYRILLFVSFITSLIGGFVIEKLNNKYLFYFFTLFACIITILNWGGRTFISDINDKYLIERAPFSTFEAEGLQFASPKWTDMDHIWEKDRPKNNLQILKGVGTIKQTKRTPIYHEYVISTNTGASVLENTLYYPGWNAYLNNSRIEINIRESDPSGTMELNIPKGLHLLVLKFEYTYERMLAMIISCVTFMLLIATIVFRKLRQ